MAKIIFEKQNISANFQINTTQSNSTGFVSERDYLKKRSKKYVNLITSLDQKTLTDTIGMNELISAIAEEFGTADLTSLPLGIVSKCFLGHPFEVHTIDLSGSQIIQHYKATELMPPFFENARGVAKHNAYALVEIYKDKLILIREDGTVTKV